MIMPDEASRASELLLMLRRVWARPPDLTGAGVSCVPIADLGSAWDMAALEGALCGFTVCS